MTGSASVFRRVQTNQKNFRAQLLRTDLRNVLWIAEDSNEIYTVCFDRILAADIYKPDPEIDSCKVILLSFIDDDDEQETESWDCGNFTFVDAQDFLKWLQSSLNVQQPVLNA